MLTQLLETTLAESEAERCLRAFRRFLLLHACVRSWLWCVFAGEAWGAGLVAAALATSVAFALAWHPRFEWLAPRVALPGLALQLAQSFPLTDNHFFLELYGMALLCLRSRSGGDAPLLLGSLRWVAVIVLFQTGLQKALYGQYFSGQFLAYMVGQGERFADPFALILSDRQIERLQAYDVLRTGQGPFRVDSLPFLLLSNLVWMLEVALAGLLVRARTRLPAAFAAIALVAAIQLGAREFGFALLFGNWLLLFTKSGNQRVLPAMLLLYVYVLGAALGILPGGSLVDAGSL